MKISPVNVSIVSPEVGRGRGAGEPIMKTKVTRMGIRQFIKHVRKEHLIDPIVTRTLMLAWRDWMLMHLPEGREVYQEHVGIFKLTKRRTGRPDRIVTDKKGVAHHVTMPPFSISVTLRAASSLQNAIKQTIQKQETK